MQAESLLDEGSLGVQIATKVDLLWDGEGETGQQAG